MPLLMGRQAGHPARWRRALCRRAALAAGLIPLGLALASSVSAQSLTTANEAAFEQSLVLRSDRARQDGAEARLRGSLDAFMPTVSFLVSKPLDSKIRYRPDIPPASFGPDTTARREADQYGISLDLTLFDGMQRWNNLLFARTQAEAGRRLTVDARQGVLLDTAGAYLAVIRDRKILAHRRRQVENLQVIRRGIDVLLAVNDATRTDAALAASRVADAIAGVEQAGADLAASELEFGRLTGLAAERTTPPRLPALPRSEAEIADLVRSQNPKLAAARLDARSAGYLADAATGALLPQVSLQFTHGRQSDITPTLDSITDTTTKIQARIPLYQPGAIPKIAEAKAFARQKWFDTEDAILQTVTVARVTFRRRAALQAQTATLARRVSALRAAMHGYEIERAAGFRTVLDELNTRAELAQGEILLATGEAERDRLAFVLASLIGRLEGNGEIATAPPPAPRIPAEALTTGSLAAGSPAPGRPGPVVARRQTASPAPVRSDAFRLRLGS